MSSKDWYRNREWNKSIENTFFEKLNRARSQRDQYLVIQALTLAPYKPKIALSLVDLYFETKKDSFEDVRALLAKKEAYEALHDTDAVISSYKAILEREVEFPNHTTHAYAEFPYFVARSKITEEYSLSLNLIEDSWDRVVFPVDGFMLSASKAIILDDLGSKAEARSSARNAIEAAQLRKSGFRYHQALGLVDKEHKDVLKRIYQIAT